MDQPNDSANKNSPRRYMTAPKVCHNPYCLFESHERIYKCPKCGRPMWTPNEFRILSSLLIPCGLFLMLVGGGLIVLSTVKATNDANKVPQYSDSRVPTAVLYFCYVLFGVILSAGMSVLAAGVWQVLTARASRWLINLLVGLIVTMFAIAFVGKSILTLLGFGSD